MFFESNTSCTWRYPILRSSRSHQPGMVHRAASCLIFPAKRNPPGDYLGVKLNEQCRGLSPTRPGFQREMLNLADVSYPRPKPDIWHWRGRSRLLRILNNGYWGYTILKGHSPVEVLQRQGTRRSLACFCCWYIYSSSKHSWWDKPERMQTKFPYARNSTDYLL